MRQTHDAEAAHLDQPCQFARRACDQAVANSFEAHTIVGDQARAAIEKT